jgi:hypothetical protein
VHIFVAVEHLVAVVTAELRLVEKLGALPVVDNGGVLFWICNLRVLFAAPLASFQCLLHNQTTKPNSNIDVQ